MKRSKLISLNIIASVFLLTSCDSGVETKQELYANKQNCADDWGVENCKESTQGRYSGPYYYFHRGYPYYFPHAGGDPRQVVTGSMAKATPATVSQRSVTTTRGTVSRGGFGRSSSFHGSSS